MALRLRHVALLLLSGAAIVATVLRAATPTVLSYTPINPVPPNVQSTPPRPLVMLNMSRDHQLFYRAYNEFSDYDNDGQPDGTYLHTVRYSGYFDPSKCYTYNATAQEFRPATVLSTRTDYCSGQWHGNFLNWATMTRMDVVRKVLYGGTRSVDTATRTVLERASLPMDAHSFAKYYANGTTETPARPNINRLTPFNETEVTFCNTTTADNAAVSHTLSTATFPPLLRAARGNFALWNAHERRQCRWGDETPWGADGGGNGNTLAVTGLAAGGDFPPRTAALAGGANGDFVVRVEVCNGSFLGTERCRTYGTSLKPIGLLQEYGDNDQAEFGLMTGSFSRNVSGGVLRKNASSFRNEINAADGTFVAGANGIVHNLDRLRVYGMRYSDNTYAANDNAGRGDQFCAFQTIGLADDRCASWGNPMGEMFIETLRYLRGNQGAGYGPSTAYGSGADAKGATMGLTVATWTDPFTRGATVDSTFGAPQCRPINAVHFNASVTSYDRDGTGPFSGLGASGSLASYVDAIGAGEGINGTSRFVGRNGTAADNNLCTAKTVGNLSDVDGLCPLAPAYQGSFTLAGAAYWANTNPIRPVPASLTGIDAQRAFRVRSYAVSLAPGVPRITVRTAGGATAVIQPAYRLAVGAGGSGTLVDFRVISQTATSGRYLLIWEDSEQGGDYDQDVGGILEWSLSGTTLTVTTDTYTQSTVNPQGFGYTVSGTNRDGVHFHSGILGFNFTDPTGAPGCTNCQVADAPTSATYTVTGNVGASLEDPLWYAAKWGGFRAANGVPAAAGSVPAAGQWDAVSNETGAPGADGIPDTYFVVFSPDQLEASLRRVFQSATAASNAAPAVSSTQLVGGGFKYVGSFEPQDASGDVLAFQVDSSGNFGATPTWRASTQMNTVAAASRVVISNDQTTGFAFDWATINGSARTAYRNLLLNGTTTLTAAQAERVVNFVRGDRTVEGANGIRSRGTNILGPIVNGAPWLQERPSARFLDRQNPGYSAFAAARRTRANVLWATSNDGMLHGFNASTGTPLLSYVPETIVPRLAELTVPDAGVRAFVDGSPFTADVDTTAGASGSPNWRTYLFSSLGRGGRGLFALDVTEPSSFTATNAGSIFRWQFTANDDPDLGHVISDVSIRTGTAQPMPVAKLADGRFALIVGNGVGSRDGRAVLFILPVQGPDATGSWAGRAIKIVLDSPNLAAGAPANGLMTPTVLDVNNDGRIDTVYVGDLRGNLWKVDLSSATPADWRSAYLAGTTPTPLWAPAAGDPVRPITGAPQFAFPSFGGLIVNFATGRSINPGDFPNTSVTQRVYGIWDRPAFASAGRALPRGHGALVARTLTRLSDGQVVVSSSPTVDFQNSDAGVARDGWYFDLPGSSEMVLSNLEFRFDNIFFTSVRPSEGSSSNCSVSPESTFYFLDPILGFANRNTLGTTTVSGTTFQVIGIPVADQKVRVTRDTLRTTVPCIGFGCTPCTGPGCAPPPPCQNAIRVVGQNTDQTLCQNSSFARFQWREVPGLRTGN